MSDRSETHRIEDVLSAVRRLVKEESSPASCGRKVLDLNKCSEKLVLTPQFRVTEPEDPYQPVQHLEPTMINTTLGEGSLEDAPDAALLILPSIEGTDDISGFDPAMERFFSASFAAVKSKRNGSQLPPPGLEGEPTTVAKPDVPRNNGRDDEADRSGSNSQKLGAHDIIKSAGLGSSSDSLGLEDHALGNPGNYMHPVGVDRYISPRDPAGRAFLGGAESVQSILSEAALRELITEIVRDELAGDLGVLISQDVRNLLSQDLREMLVNDDFN